MWRTTGDVLEWYKIEFEHFPVTHCVIWGVVAATIVAALVLLT